jgi:hypothetical protein
MGNEAKMPAALCGSTDGAAWVAEDVLETRCSGRDNLVERLASAGVRSVLIRAESRGAMCLMWLKLNQMVPVYLGR